MIKLPAIVTFANQKGGVGKTTLCVLFAHYLSARGVKVRIVDCDRQLSIFRRRKADIGRYGEENLPFVVEQSKIDTKEDVRRLLGNILNDKNYDITLLDTPGSIITESSQYVLSNTQMIVVPFHYDKTTLSSTSTFIICLDTLKRFFKGQMETRLYLVPNLHDSRVGTRKELQLWEEARDIYSRYGTVTPKVSRVADLERFSTVMYFDQQAKYVTSVFDKLYFDIFDTMESYRPTDSQTDERKTPDTPTLIEVAHELVSQIHKTEPEKSETNPEVTDNSNTDEKPEQ